MHLCVLTRVCPDDCFDLFPGRSGGGDHENLASHSGTDFRSRLQLNSGLVRRVGLGPVVSGNAFDDVLNDERRKGPPWGTPMMPRDGSRKRQAT